MSYSDDCIPMKQKASSAKFCQLCKDTWVAVSSLRRIGWRRKAILCLLTPRRRMGIPLHLPRSTPSSRNLSRKLPGKVCRRGNAMTILTVAILMTNNKNGCGITWNWVENSSSSKSKWLGFDINTPPLPVNITNMSCAQQPTATAVPAVIFLSGHQKSTNNDHQIAHTRNIKITRKKVIRVLLDSRSDGDLWFHKMGTTKQFSYWTR